MTNGPYLRRVKFGVVVARHEVIRPALLHRQIAGSSNQIRVFRRLSNQIRVFARRKRRSTVRVYTWRFHTVQTLVVRGLKQCRRVEAGYTCGMCMDTFPARSNNPFHTYVVLRLTLNLTNSITTGYSPTIVVMRFCSRRCF